MMILGRHILGSHVAVMAAMYYHICYLFSPSVIPQCA